MIFMSSEEFAVFQLLDPASARRLVIGRTGRAYVWDPIASTTEVQLNAARALVAEGIVDSRGRIAPEHLGLWQQRGTTPLARSPQRASRSLLPEQAGSVTPGAFFERTLPIGQTSEALRAMG